MARLDAWRATIVFMIGLWLSIPLGYYLVPEGLAVGLPFVLVYAWWNFPAWRDRVRLNRDIREFQKGHNGNEQSVR